MTPDTTSETTPDTRGKRSAGARSVRVVFRLVMAALILVLAVRTYEETAVAHARSNGTLHRAEATITELTSHTESGRTGGGQDGSSGDYVVTTVYTIELRVGDDTKTAQDVPDDTAYDLQEGQRVVAGLWHGRVVEIDGRDVWPGWHPAPWDITLYVLYPLIMGYAIGFAVAAVAFLAGLGGRARLEWQDRTGPWLLGFLVGTAAIFTLLVCAAFGNGPVYWPVVPIGAGTAAALARLAVVVRRKRRSARAEDTPAPV